MKSLMEHTSLTASDFYQAKWLLYNAQMFYLWFFFWTQYKCICKNQLFTWSFWCCKL